MTGIAHNSAALRPGDLYAALAGSRRHGAEFTAQAIESGAVAILTDEAGADVTRAAHLVVPLLVTDDPRAILGQVAAAIYGRPTDALPVIGLTGTAGKTTTSYLIESGLRAAGHITCLVGTVETRIADTVINSERTTPEATDLHALFATARELGVTAAVMEVSSHALSYGRVGGVRFAVGGFTNFGLDHLDFHAGVDDYFAAKARLFDGRCRAEVLNLDDPLVRQLVRPGRITYSAYGDPAATWCADDAARDGFEQSFTVRGPHGVTLRATVNLPGHHNVANALLAIACLAEVGVDPDTAARGVAGCRGVPGRLERVDAPGPVLGVVDYAHKPDAIVAALAALREVTTKRLICVIGAGGDRDRGKRGPMGAAAARGADIVVVTDDNPRMEDPAVIRAQVREGALDASDPNASHPNASHRNASHRNASAARVVEVGGRRQAIAEAVRLAQPGDVVAVLGKGHERDQEVGGTTVAFDDRVELAAALSDRFVGARA